MNGDPWTVSQSLTSSCQDHEITVASARTQYITPTLKNTSTFEDNFNPDNSVSGEHITAVGFEKLPDSEAYLAILERRLKKLSSASNKKEEGKEILRALEESRESCMLRMLSGLSKPVEDLSLFEDFKVNRILKRIQPDKQALSAEELIQLVKADQLTVGTEEAHQEETLETN